MARKLLLYHGHTFVKGQQVFCCIASTTQKKVLDITGISRNELKDYWNTDSEEDARDWEGRDIALNNPDVLYVINTVRTCLNFSPFITEKEFIKKYS